MTARVEITSRQVRYAKMKDYQTAQRRLIEKEAFEAKEKARIKREKEEENSGSWMAWMHQKRQQILADKSLRADNPLYVWARFVYPFSPSYDSETKAGKTILTLKDALGKVIKQVTVDNREEVGSAEADKFLRFMDRTESRYHEAALHLIRLRAEENENDNVAVDEVQPLDVG